MRCDRRSTWVRAGRVAVPLTALAVVLAVVSGVGNGVAKGVQQRNDPNVTNQAAVLVLQTNSNPIPASYCTGTPDVGPAAPCSVAIFGVGRTTDSTTYSTTTCTATGTTLAPCTAKPYLPSSAAAAVSGYKGSTCQPQSCLLILVLTQANGNYGAPSPCTQNYYLNGSCTVADIDTTGKSGAATLPASTTPCSSSGDLTAPCTSAPFLPGNMALSLPPATTNTTPASTAGQDVNIQSAVLVIAPVNDPVEDYNPAAPCGTFGLNPASPCEAAQFVLTGSTKALTYSGPYCPQAPTTSMGACTSNALQASIGGPALAGYPGSSCATTATPPATVDCRLFMVLVPDGGEYGPPGPCSMMTSGFSAGCTLAVVPTDGLKGGETLALPTADCGAIAAPADLTACTATPFLNMGIKVTLPHGVYPQTTPKPSPTPAPSPSPSPGS